MIKKKQLAVAIAATFVATGVAYAQQQPQKVEKVEVTGSNIKRVDTETAAPIQVISREDIARSGATTIAEVLRNIPASNAGSVSEAAVASFTPGANAPSLRGLGGAATLVLINGRRVAPHGFAVGGQTTFVDVNSIPPAAVERIEVLLDGASAIYGSEAMAGVINIIMRKDYTGVIAAGSYGRSSRSDGESTNLSLVFGKGSLASDRYNVFGALSYGEGGAVSAANRPTTRTSDYRGLGSIDRRSTYSNPGNAYNAANTAFVGVLPGCATIGTAADGGLAGRCLYDFAQYTDLIPETKKASGYLRGTFALNADVELFGELSATQSKFLQNSASYNVTTLGYNGIILPASHPQNTFGRDVAIRYRLSDVPQTISATSDTLRGVAGAKATFGAWDFESALLYSSSDTDVTYRGFPRDSVLADEVLVSGTSNVRNSVTLGNLSADLRGRLYPSLVNNGKTSVTGIDFKASRELMSLPGGYLGFAFGADYRRESFKTKPDALVEAGEISTLGTSSADGSRNVSAAFVEFSLPVVKNVEAQLAGRIDNYSDFGSKFTPKFAVKWRAAPFAILRATYSEGFRAPSLTETSSSPVTGFFNGVRDPQNCPVPDANNVNCSLQVRATLGANPNLKPETSRSYVFGVVLEPSKDVSVAVDYYDIKRQNEISSLDTEYLLANERLYPGYVIRDSAGLITGLRLPYENLGSTNVRGLDVDLRGSASLGEMGKLSTQFLYNYMPTYLVKPVANAEELNYAGTYLQPKERFRIATTWTRGPWEANVIWNRTGSYLRAFTPSDLTCALTAAQIAGGQCGVKAWSTTDLVVRYTGFRNLVATLAVMNIEDRQPPLDQRRETRFTWYQPNFHSAMGRFYRVGLSYEFK